MAKSIGNIIRELRCARGLTQEQLAESLNVTAQAISKWENNIGLPDISQLAPLAYFFNVSTDVLLGIAEIDSNDEIEKIIKKASGLESYKEEYDALQKALKDFPGNLRLLFEVLSCGVCLISDNNILKAEKNKIYEESERAGKLILSYAKQLDLLIHTHQWLIKLYCEMGKTDKAQTLSENIPYSFSFNKYEALARIFEAEKKYNPAAQYYESNIVQSYQCLMHALTLAGNMYAQDRNKGNARQMYKSAIDMGKYLLSSNYSFISASMTKNTKKIIERCEKQLNLLK